MSGTWQDLKHAARMLAARPGWTAGAVLSLALGIGVNTAAFSVADALFLRPLPAAAPEQLMELRAVAEGKRSEGLYFLEYRDLAASTNSFSGLTAFSSRGSMLKREGQSELVGVYVVDGNFFDVMDVDAEVGRTLRPELNSSPDGQPEVMISHSLWQRRFGGDRTLVGSQIRLNDAFVTVVGVVPPSFPSLDRGYVVDLWESPAAWIRTTNARSDLDARSSRQFEVIGRLKPGAGKLQAQSEVEAVGRRLASVYPATNRDVRFTASLIREEQIQKALQPVGLMLAIVALVLWIACGNVAGLELARGEGRRREIGIRQALGASRLRLARQLMTESALLAVLGAGGGLLLAGWLLRALPALLPPGPLPTDYGLGLDARVCAFTLLLVVLSVLLSGLMPALRAADADVAPALKSQVAGSARARWIWRSAVVVIQVGMAMVLLNTAGLLLRSFLHTRAESPGFDASRNIAGLFLFTPGLEQRAGVAAAYERMRAEAESLPGVIRATYARRIPMSSSGGGATVKVQFPTLDLPEDQRRAGIRYNEVAPNYFETLGTRLLRGRAFTRLDHAAAPAVVIVSEALVKRWFSGRDPLEQSLRIGGKDLRIAGVVENARMNSIHEEPQPFIYFPFDQRPSAEATLMVQTSGPPAALLPALKQAARKAVPRAEVLETLTLSSHMKGVLFQDWVQAVLSSGVAALGVALAALGLFAAVSCSVGRRFREFGIRIALGARRLDVFGLVLRQGLAMAAAGVVLGAAASFAAARMLQGALYGVGPGDPLTLALSGLAAIGVALAASLQPARRAVSADPAVTLRDE
ncbi:MAG: ABC transporter permease [Candidatus Solibacter usitatus]|nr:ABC transporter permease [Candidatus Solibacter usitatus]